MYDLLSLEAFTPRSMTRMAFEMARLLAEALKCLVPARDNRAVLQELGNKLRAFELFEHVDSVLRPDPCSSFSLQALVTKAYALGPYLAVWATEGLGHYCAERCWEQNGIPRGLLTGGGDSALPAESMAALHAGMGLSFANRVLERIAPNPSRPEVQAAIRQFLMHCDNNSMPAYRGAAHESLGLVARSLYPHVVQTIEEQLREIDTTLVGYFWHGVGRAIYFAPTNFWPGRSSPWRGLEMILSGLPNELARLNAIAGLIWAMTLVNIRQPEVLETLLKHHGDQLSESDALSNGVSSSIIIWYDSTLDEGYIAGLCRHRPSDPHLLKLWKNNVARPCEDALQEYYHVLKEHESIGEVFRYQRLSELAARLERVGQGIDLNFGLRQRNETAIRSND